LRLDKQSSFLKLFYRFQIRPVQLFFFLQSFQDGIACQPLERVDAIQRADLLSIFFDPSAGVIGFGGLARVALPICGAPVDGLFHEVSFIRRVFDYKRKVFQIFVGGFLSCNASVHEREGRAV